MNPRDAYRELQRLSRERAILESCASLLNWDEQTGMPPRGADLRAEQHGLIAGLAHERATQPRIGEWLAILEESELVADPLSVESVNAREWRRKYNRATRLPQNLVAEIASTTSHAQQHWTVARRERDFSRFRGWLERILMLKRNEAQCLAQSGQTPYDALLEDYEPGASESLLRPLFAEVRSKLQPLIQRWVGAGRQPDPSILQRTFPVDRQRHLGQAVAAAIGFDFLAGRLDSSAHPFCSGFGPGDCRITTRYAENDFSESFFGILHEVGHALYEQGLDPTHFGTPMGEAVSLGIHESQSRFWENLIGRSLAFWKFWYPTTRGLFHEALGDVTLDAFHAAIHAVEPSLIRTQADEATYNLHIVIRFELELELLANHLPVDELPDAWNAKYQEMLGIKPANDAEGCLQDIHWAAGLFGYFPTYTLGNLYAAQFFQAAERELGSLDPAISAGDFTPIRNWLRERIHLQGSRYRPEELVARVTGATASADAFVEDLTRRFDPVFGL
jgi:carboxypeptidase Taq